MAWNTLVFKWSIQSQNFQQHIVNLDLLFASNDFERKQLVGRLLFLGIVRPYTKQQKHHWGNLLPPVMAGTSKRPPLLWGFQPRPRIGDTQGLRCSCSPFSGKSTYPHCNVPLPEMRPALLNPYFWGGMLGGGRLTSHDIKFIKTTKKNQVDYRITIIFNTWSRCWTRPHQKKIHIANPADTGKRTRRKREGALNL